MTFSLRSLALGLTAGLALAAPARADLVVLSSGRVMSASSVVLTDDTATIRLRSGGEVTCDRIARRPRRPRRDAVDRPGRRGCRGRRPATPATPRRRRRRSAPSRSRPPIARIITRLAEAHGVDARLIHAVISVESAYRPRARSRKGARGLMQLMPATARQYGVRNAYKEAANLDAGVRHLKTLLDRFAVREAIAAYNAGEAAVRRFGGVPPFRETRAYVERVLSLAGLDVAEEPPADADRPGS